MWHRSLADEECAVARSMQQVGQWWTILILRNVFLGMHRFAELESSLEIAPTTLTRRLRAMIGDDLLKKNGDEYVLTQKGEEFLPVLMALVAWGNRWTSGGKAVIPVWANTSREIVPHVVDKKTGRRLEPGTVAMGSGPAASRAMREFLTPPRTLGTATRRKR
jgi:DNA-binding HxlR family transcriptional regulator